MPWKKIGGNRYFYRTVRIGKRFRSEYEGHGLVAELAAEILDCRRTTRRKLREADLRDVEYFREEQRELGLDAFCREVEDLARAAMAAAGFHRHKRGHWRRRRMPRSNASATTLAMANSSTSAAETKDSKSYSLAIAALTASSEEAQNRRALVEFISLPAEEFDRRIEQARAGDPASLDWLRRAFETDPTGKLESLYGNDAGKQIERLLVIRIAGDDQVTRTSLLAQVERMRRDLAGPEPSAMERLLADRVALSWLSLHTLELQFERSKHELGPQLAEAMERRIGRLTRQFHESAKTMAVVRRLAAPALQVMIAERQANFFDRSGNQGRSSQATARPARSIETR